MIDCVKNEQVVRHVMYQGTITAAMLYANSCRQIPYHAFVGVIRAGNVTS